MHGDRRMATESVWCEGLTETITSAALWVGLYGIGIESIRPTTNTNGSTNKQIRSFAYFDEQYAVLMLIPLYAQMI